MTFVSYAQNFEDVLLWRALHDIERGRYLDIGAQDPVVDSVSLAFYNAGWRGVHVEPARHYAARLREARPDETIVEALVTDAEGSIDFFEIPDTGLSTGVVDIARRHSRLGFVNQKRLVPCVALSRLLESHGGVIHWMKIDVEGMEPHVLRSWGDSVVRPWILVIESTTPNSQQPTHERWIHEVLSRGYHEVFFDGLSRYFLHEAHCDRQAAFESPANVFDCFAVSDHHFAARRVCAELEAAKSRIADEEKSGSELASRLSKAEQRLESESERANHLDAESAHAKELAAAARASLTRATAEVAEARAAQAESAAKLVEATREYAAALATSSKKREADEKRLRRHFEKKLSQARAALDGARVTVARLEEQSSALQRELSSELEQRRATEHDLRSQLNKTEETLQHHVEQSAVNSARAQQAERARTELELELGRQSAALASAAALISAVHDEPTGWWRQLGERLGLAKPSPALHQLISWSASNDNHRAAPQISQTVRWESGRVMRSSPPAKGRNPYLRASSLAEIISWDDIDFVRVAYLTVLGREPDAEGEAYYTNRIREGHSKLELLWQLRSSEEGAQYDPGIAGLDRALRSAAWARHRLFGPFVRLVTSNNEGRRRDNQHRAIMNQLTLLRNEQWIHRHLLDSLSGRLRELVVAVPERKEEPTRPAVSTALYVKPARTLSAQEVARQSLDSRERHVLDLLEAQA